MTRGETRYKLNELRMMLNDGEHGEEQGMLVDIIKELDKAENKGEWERVCGGSLIDEYRCSKCKHLPPKKPLPDIKTWGWDFTDFCPNCGADMSEPKGEKEPE